MLSRTFGSLKGIFGIDIYFFSSILTSSGKEEVRKWNQSSTQIPLDNRQLFDWETAKEGFTNKVFQLI